VSSRLEPWRKASGLQAAVLSSRTEPLTNSRATAPAPKRLVAELLALVSDEMSGYGSGLPNGSTEKRPDRLCLL